MDHYDDFRDDISWESSPKPLEHKPQTPKLKDEDRIKLIDRPELLMVVPKTHAASVRYGNGAKWCTAVPNNDRHFKEYTQNGFLVYLIYYETTEDNKRDKEQTKIAVSIGPVNKRDSIPMSAWSKANNPIELEVFKYAIMNDEIADLIVDYYSEFFESKYKYDIGSEIECNDWSDKFDTIKIELKGDNWSSNIYLHPCDIGKCVVTKINDKSVRADIKTLTLKTPLPAEVKEMLLAQVKNGKINVNLRNDFIVGHSSDDIKPKILNHI